MHGLTIVGAKIALGASLALGFLVSPSAIAHADDTISLTTMTVDGVDYPVCDEEDCSDQVGQVGLWLDEDTGDWYLELGEDVTYLVIDDTVRQYLTQDDEPLTFGSGVLSCVDAISRADSLGTDYRTVPLTQNGEHG